MSNKIIDCKMLVREISNSRCFYIDYGTHHSVLLDTLDISADREAMEAQIAALHAELAAVGRLREALKLVTECFISILGNVNTAEILMPKIVETLKEHGYGSLADDLALTGFAAALEEKQ